MKRKVQWKLYRKDDYLGEFDTDQIVIMTGMRRNNISTYADFGNLYKGEYRLERVDPNDELQQDWEKAINMLKNGSTKKGGSIKNRLPGDKKI